MGLAWRLYPCLFAIHRLRRCLRGFAAVYPLVRCHYRSFDWNRVVRWGDEFGRTRRRRLFRVTTLSRGIDVTLD
ncbi:hypothetical protein [Rhizobium bangladeshense]|uniref:hypothetical protein n=1 Tax=Rhizobium bangladeshense TaxID=1138189 RepID=UPI0012E98CB6|nr:hypothetical protein [Rhizobium bangladeshense]